jgi:DNA (cytosine-5)-methyltransferase 1
MKRLLDLFCGAGGAAMGYHRAGFEVVGVDNRPQKRFPFEFHQADALEYLKEHGREFDFIHASPPCQRFSVMRRGRWQDREHPDLLTPTRELLGKIGRPYVIENVVGAPLINPVMLCGTLFGLKTKAGSQLRRHRLFEIHPPLLVLTPQCLHATEASVIGVYGGGQHPQRRRFPLTIGVFGHSGGTSRRDYPDMDCFTTNDRRDAMGIDWMTGKELSEAIPPAYTEYIGKQVLMVDNPPKIRDGR